MSDTNKVNQRRTLQSTLLLLAIMLDSSARDEQEKAFAPVANALMQIQNPVIDSILKELVDQGYAEIDREGNFYLTKFGEKIALSCTHNTPNFQRLADGSTNVAFAMMFASFGSLRDKHLVGQEKIVAGAGGGNLVNNLKELTAFFDSRLQVTEEKVAAPAKSKKGQFVKAPTTTEATLAEVV